MGALLLGDGDRRRLGKPDYVGADVNDLRQSSEWKQGFEEGRQAVSDRLAAAEALLHAVVSWYVDELEYITEPAPIKKARAFLDGAP